MQAFIRIFYPGNLSLVLQITKFHGEYVKALEVVEKQRGEPLH